MNNPYEARLISSGHGYNIYVNNKFIGLPEPVAKFYRLTGVDKDFFYFNGIPLVGFSTRENKYFAWDTLNMVNFKYKGFGIGDVVRRWDVGFYNKSIEDVRDICDNYRYDDTCIDYNQLRIYEDEPKIS